MSANVETMFSVRETPWHGMGTIISEAPTSEDALHLAGLDWEVKQAPMLANIDGVAHDTDYIMNYRSSDNALLGLVQGQYKVVQNKDAFAFTDAIVDGKDTVYETAGSLKGGRLVWMLAKMPTMNVLGDAIEPYMLFSNSHDGSSAVKVCMTNIRVVCNNTLNLALRNAKRTWSFVHKGNVEYHMEEAKKSIFLAQGYNVSFVNEAEHLASIKFSPAQMGNIVDTLFPMNLEDDSETSKRKLGNLEIMRDSFLKCLDADDVQNFKNTAWGLIQGASDYAYHTRPLRLTSSFTENRMLSVINGNKFLDNTYDILRKVA